MIKICFIVTDVVSFNFLMKGQLEYLKNLNKYEITLVSGGSSDGINKLKNRDVGDFNYIPFKRKPGLSDIYCLIKLFWFLMLNRQDVIIYSTPKAMLLGSIASFLSAHRKRICIVRGRVYENFTGIKRKFFEAIDFLSLSLSTRCLFISDSLLNEYIDNKLLFLSNYKVVGKGSSNGIDKSWVNEPFISPNPEEISENIGLDKDDFLILTVGRLCIDKGIKEFEEIVNFFSDKENIKFISIGKIEDEVSNEVVSKLKALKNYTYFEQADDVRGFYLLADLHLFLTHREGFGNVAIEAASFNVPTFAFNVVGVRDSVCDGVSGKLYEPYETESIIQSINYYSESKEQLSLDYPEAKDWAYQNYSSGLVWDLYEKEYSR